MLLDLHTHHPAPQPDALISVSPAELSSVSRQLYSVGYHPWNTKTKLSESQIEALRAAAGLPYVGAIGECGIDVAKGGPMFVQLLNFKTHVEISETVGKPLVIHSVKAPDMILGLHRDLLPSQTWVIHGFRGKPQVAEMYLRAGIALSFGEFFNPDSLRITPRELLFAETDESSLSIHEIIARLSETVGEDLTPCIASNMASLIPNS